MNAQEQPRRPETPKTPWVRDPQPPKSETKHAPVREESQPHEEPGYGHGV